MRSTVRSYGGGGSGSGGGVDLTTAQDVEGEKSFLDGLRIGSTDVRVVIDPLGDTQGVWIDATLADAANPNISIKLRAKGPSGKIEAHSPLDAVDGLLIGGVSTGTAALKDVGTSAGTVAAGDDTRITGAAQKASNLSDLANAGTARTNLGLGTAATLASSAVAQVANNLSDLASVATARTNLGLGTAATHPAGDFALVANNLSDLANAGTARTNLAVPGLATLTTKGDLYVATGSAAVARQAAGSNAQLLMADSNAANGVRYASVSGVSTFGPLDLGFLGGNGDPATCPGGTLLSASAAAGGLVIAKIRVPVACTITNLIVYLTASGGTLTAGRNLAGLFTSAGVLVKTSVDQSANWVAAAGMVTMQLASTYAAAAGDYYVGMFYTGTTAPTFARYSVTSAGLTNAGLSAPNLRFATTSDTGLTTAMPSNLGTQTATAAAYFAAVS